VSAVRRLDVRLVPAEGFRSQEVAVKVAELAAVHDLIREAVHDLSPAQLMSQSAPGRNTIGMLIAHIAIVETHLGQVILRAEPQGHVADVLGMSSDDDAMPLPAGGAPPARLAGKDEAFYLDLLSRAHAHTRAACAPLTDADLATGIVRPPRPDGTQRVFDRRYALFHMLEHAALHMGQIRSLKAVLTTG